MSAVFFKYFLGQWKLCKIDEAYIGTQIELKRLTQEEASEILATERNCE